MKQWFPVSQTNANRAGAGSKEGLAGRAYPILIANRLRKDKELRGKVCAALHHKACDFKDVLVGKALKKNVQSVIAGARKTPSKTTLRILWNDGTYSNFIVKKSGPAHICLKKVEHFIPEFEAQFNTKVPKIVQEALLLFLGRHKNQKSILDSISVNYVGDKVRDLERTYRNRLTLASMYGYNELMADSLLDWFRANSAELVEYCFSLGAVKDRSEAAEYLWYHSSNKADSAFEIIDLVALASKLRALAPSQIAPLVCPRDSEMVGSTINLPFGNLQYHEDALEFRHDRQRIYHVLELKAQRRTTFGSEPKESGHRNEMLIASTLCSDKAFLAHFCERVGRSPEEFQSADAGGKHAKQEESVLGGKTPGKTDVTVLWKDGTRTNISVKKRSAGQVYLVTAKNFVGAYEAHYGVVVPSKVRRALAFFIGEDPESRSILDATDLAVDGQEARNQAYRQNSRLMFEVIRNYDGEMADKLLEFLRVKLDNVFELCFAAGAVKDKSLWSNVLWYKNLVDTKGMGLDYLVSIPVVKAAIRRNYSRLVVKPGDENAGSTIHLPFGHLQYFHKQLEFYQKLAKIQALLMS